MTNTNQTVHFTDFLACFPEVELPITLSDKTHHDFSKHNEPLPHLMIANYLQPIEGELEADEYTEYIACFRIPETHNFHAVVYWKAELLNYTYTLVTFGRNGDLLDKRVIAGTFSDGKIITQSIARIDTDWMIYVLSGQNESDENYDPLSSKAIDLELTPDGFISESL